MSFDDEHGDRERRERRPRPDRGPAGGGGFPILGLFALLIALATAGYVLYRDPPWGRLGKYDFSTPEKAAKSKWRMKADGDYRALEEYEAQRLKKDWKKQYDTLKVEDASEVRGKTVVFVRYMSIEPGKRTEREVKQVVWYEKDEEGRFRETVPLDRNELQQRDERLFNKIERWEGREPTPKTAPNVID